MAQRTRPTAATASTKSKYRVTNWAAYNRALVSRGEVTLWIDEAVLSGWRATGGKGKRYSDAAILCALSLRAVFRMPLRQTQGFLTSLKNLLGLKIRCRTIRPSRAALAVLMCRARRRLRRAGRCI